jgi:competence protein ComEC
MLDRAITRFIFGFLGAVAWSSFFSIPSYREIWFWLVASCLIVFGFFAPKKWMMLPIVLGIVVACVRFQMVDSHHSQYPLDRFVDEQQQVELVGYIDSSPEPKSYLTSFILNTECLMAAGSCLPVSTRIRISTDSYGAYNLGDRVSVSVIPKKPEAFETETGRIFDYQKYLYKDNVQYIGSYASVQKIGGIENTLQRQLFLLKERFLEKMYRVVPRPESGLLAGVLFGEKTALDAEYEERFRTVGLMHIIVLSGYNVSLVIYGVMFLLRFLPLYVRSILAVVGIVAFAILVGAGPTVIRASIMALLIVLAKVLGRKYNIERSLLLAGFLMVAWNPLILVFDISFQLSFLATYGLIVFTPILKPYLRKIPEAFALRESLGATIAAQIFVLPLLLYAIGEFSLVSVIVNMLVLWAVPVAMLFGFLVSLVSFAPVIQMLFGFVATVFLRYILVVVDVFEGFPLALITFPPFHWVWLLFLYGLLWLWLRHLRAQIRQGEAM